MFKLGYLTVQPTEENEHLNYLTNKGWNLTTIDINEQMENYENLDAIIVFEETMPITCCWLMELKKFVSAPIYLLSKANDSHSNIVYLQLGIEACFQMKMEPEELYFTLINLLTNYAKKGKSLLERGIETIQKKGLELIPRNLSVSIAGGKEIPLTKKEYQALELLYNNPCKTISYEEFKEKLWVLEPDIDNKNYRIANLIFHLRNKIETNIADPKFIKTVRSKGYMLDLK